MKIGLITPAWPGMQTANGIATAVYNLAHGFRDTGQDVVILPFTQDGPAGENPVVPVSQRSWSLSEKLRYKLERIAGGDRVAVEIQAMRIAEAVQDAQRRHGLDVVVIEETQGWAGYLQKLVDIPVVITLHGPWFLHKALQSTNTDRRDRARERREAMAIRSVSGITAPSLAVLSATQAELRLPAEIPRMVLRNPIPLPGAQEQGSPSPTDVSNLLFVGRFDRHKGGDTILAAFDLVARSKPTASLTFVGPDRGFEEADGTRRHINDALSKLAPNIRSRILYLGQRSTDEIEDLRRTHAVTVIASRYENLNYTMLEAMAHGSALVATNVGGPAEVLRHEETALLVPPDDPQAMAAASARLLDDPDLRFRLGRAAQDVIRHEFKPTFVAAQMADFLEEVIARRASSRRR